MAFIPKVTSSREVSKQDVMISKSPDYYSAQQIDRIGSTLMQFGKQLEDIDNFRQTSSAKIAMQSELSTLKTEALSNPDLSAREDYYNRIDQSVEQVADTIKNPIARDQFLVQGKSLALSTKADIKLKTYQESIDLAKDNLKLSANIAMDLAINSNDEQTVNAATVDYYTNLEESVSSGLINEAERDLRIQDFVEKVRIGQVDRAIMTDAANALTMIENDEFGLTESEKVEKIGEAKRAVNRQLQEIEYLEKKTQYDNGRKIINELIDSGFKAYTPSQIDTMRLERTISEEMASLSKKMINSNPINAYNSLTEISRLDLERSNFLDKDTNLSDNEMVDVGNKTIIGYMKLLADGKITPAQFQKKAGAIQIELEDIELARANKVSRQGFNRLLAQVTVGAMGTSMFYFSDMVDSNTLKRQQTTNEQMRNFLLKSAQAEDPNMTEERMDSIINGEAQDMFVVTYNTETGVFE